MFGIKIYRDTKTGVISVSEIIRTYMLYEPYFRKYQGYTEALLIYKTKELADLHKAKTTSQLYLHLCRFALL